MSLQQIYALAVANRFELLAVIFGIVSVYLSAREKIWSWPTALVNVSLYSIVFYQAKLYANMALQVIYFALSLYGWYKWLYGGENRTALRVSRLARALGVRLLLIGATVAVVLGVALSRFTDAPVPYLDPATMSTSLVAQWMMTRKILENWLVWIAVDVVYVGLFIHQRLFLTAGLYTVFLVLAVFGYLGWRRSLASRTPPAHGDRSPSGASAPAA